MPKNQNIKEKTSILQKTDQYLGMISFLFFLYGSGIVLPLYHRNGYFDLMEAKADLFFVMMKTLLPFLAVLFVVRIIRKQIILSFFTVSLFCFLLSALISTYFSFAPENAFTGDQGWYVGFFTILCLILCLLVFRDEKIIYNKIIYLPIFLVFLFELIMTLTDAMGYDLLSMRKNLPDYYRLSYFATIGNSNWCAGYLSLFLPLLICLYLSSEKLIWTGFFLVLSSTDIVVSILIGADAIFISMFLSAVIIGFYFVESIVRIRRFFILLSFVLTGIFLIGMNSRFADFLWLYKGTGRVFFEYPTFDIGLAAVSGMLAMISFNIKEENYQRRKKIVALALKIFLVFFVLAVIHMIYIYKGHQIDSNRFELWNLSIRKFSQFSFFHKMFGLGPELLRNIYSSMYAKYGVIYTVAHSEPIQILLTMGISGLLFWILCWICLLVSVIKTKAYQDPLSLGLSVSLVSYLGQSFVNSATILNLCIFTIILISLLRRINTRPGINNKLKQK